MDYDCIVRLYRTDTDYLEWRKKFGNRQRIFNFVESIILNKETDYVRISVDIALPGTYGYRKTGAFGETL